jgi:hypothetical protein
MDDVVGDAGFGEEYVHVTGQPTGYRMDREANLGATRAQ